MALLFESVKYGAINTTDAEKTLFCVIMLKSEANTLQDNTTIDGKFITAGKLVFKSQYICSMRVKTNWYWCQHT